MEIKDMTTEIIPREKCRFCKVYLAKNCLNDICVDCSKLRTSKIHPTKGWF